MSSFHHPDSQKDHHEMKYRMILMNESEPESILISNKESKIQSKQEFQDSKRSPDRYKERQRTASDWKPIPSWLSISPWVY